MYDELLVEQLRSRANWLDFATLTKADGKTDAKLLRRAADAIEELLASCNNFEAALKDSVLEHEKVEKRGRVMNCKDCCQDCQQIGCDIEMESCTGYVKKTDYCETCVYYPPSSCDGKPCTQCDPEIDFLSCYIKKPKERPIKELTEDEVKEYRIIKAALDAGATIKKAKEGEGGVFLRGERITKDNLGDILFNPTVTNADLVRVMTDEELAEWASIREMCFIYHLLINDPDLRNRCRIYENCKDCWLEWLKQEASND